MKAVIVLSFAAVAFFVFMANGQFMFFVHNMGKGDELFYEALVFGVLWAFACGVLALMWGFYKLVQPAKLPQQPVVTRDRIF